jgi:hypothetical protein
MDIDKRIKALEKVYGNGTIIQRVYKPGDGNGVGWTIGLGQISLTKTFFSADTIEECLQRAEDSLTKSE